MALSGRALRRGLPRVVGGEPWPPAGVPAGSGAAAAPAAAATQVAASAPEVAAPVLADAVAAPGAVTPAGLHEPAAPEQDGGAGAASVPGVALRRGLPRVPGGEAWPSASVSAPQSVVATSAAVEPPQVTAECEAAPATVAPPSVVATPDAANPPLVAGEPGAELRRGLPRTAGGDAWPPAGTARILAAPAVAAETADAGATSPGPAASAVPAASAEPASAVTEAAAVARPADPRAPLTVPRTVWPGRAAFHRPPAKPEPQRVGPFTKAQWAGVVVIGGGGLLVAAALAVLFVRAFLSLPFMQDFLAAYPGEYHLPESAPVGIPAWLGWQHFLNGFFMLLIIKTGLTIRTEKRPAVFWTPRRNKKGKTSLTIWLHQSIDLLWIVNGLVFVVLLFVTGQWMRIVPTSWEVFPNALSAALQYVSLDWPTENGWVNYNSLQQLAYFSTVFLAAPLAFVTGIRMSGVWPKKAPKLNAAYPIEWARKVHFPVMLFFVVFIVVHVALVLSTGALRNLNHMYAAQGSTDPTAYADNWLGFWMFVLSLVAMAGAWIAARPLVVAPIARIFGTVSGR
ncbi:cytochrome b/b6 domain-containing protein [Microbacterium telephonicum]|uniref:Thiosulfate reductase cytochrome b subunit n=1 Tax=Microbacterium telephonicum TaxID=1714841 RepID=A0A498C1N7_9MICO|nr:cytochrome b/b6 domain-containing protein [Microbacterium telephonicum]RLK46728.1 thiosulfate reductase cytochrome b subunit [Microbacterium telephonicum]